MDSRLNLAEAQARREERLDLAITQRTRAGLLAATRALKNRGWVESKYVRGSHGRFGAKPDVPGGAAKPDTPGSGKPMRVSDRFSDQGARQRQDLGLRTLAGPLQRTPGDTAVTRLPTPTLENVHEVIESIPPDVRARIAEWPPRKGPTAKRVLGVAVDTRSKHVGNDGAYSKSRKVWHEKIQAHFLALAASQGAAPKEAPIAHLTAGGPGAGKTTMAQAATSHVPKDAVNVDVDEIRYLLPEFQQMIHPDWSEAQIKDEIARLMEIPAPGQSRNKPQPIRAGDAPPDAAAAWATQEEANDIRDELLKDVQELRLDAVIDGTGDGLDGWFADYIARLRKSGFRIHVHYADAPVDKALQRSVRRAQQYGRWLAPEFVAETHEKVGRNVQDVLDSPDVEALTIHDVSERYRAKPVAIILGGEGTLRERLDATPDLVRSPSLFNDFVSRYDSE